MAPHQESVASISNEGRELENDDIMKPSSPEDPDAEFGGTEARKELERNLLWKIDLRSDR